MIALLGHPICKAEILHLDVEEVPLGMQFLVDQTLLAVDFQVLGD